MKESAVSKRGTKGVIEGRVDFCTIAGIALWAKQEGFPFRTRSDLVSGALDTFYELLIKQGNVAPVTSIVEADEILNMCGIGSLIRGGARRQNLLNAIQKFDAVTLGNVAPDGVDQRQYLQAVKTYETLQSAPVEEGYYSVREIKKRELMKNDPSLTMEQAYKLTDEYLAQFPDEKEEDLEQIAANKRKNQLDGIHKQLKREAVKLPPGYEEQEAAYNLADGRQPEPVIKELPKSGDEIYQEAKASASANDLTDDMDAFCQQMQNKAPEEELSTAALTQNASPSQDEEKGSEDD